MSIIIFFIVLGVLVFIHELGHFLAAKGAGVRVDEFGFGYPPRALKLGRKWGTLFTLNWIPFGGFVKIFGEDYDNTSPPNPPLLDKERGASPYSESNLNLKGGEVGKNFTQVSKKWQAGILVAGVAFNIAFAWLLFSLGFVIGLPVPAENEFGEDVRDPVLTIVDVMPDSPAQKAGLKGGDKITGIAYESGVSLAEINPERVSDFINKSPGEVLIKADRGNEKLEFEIIPASGIEEGRKIIGVSMDMMGTLSLPVHKAIYQGGRVTVEITYLTVKGIVGLVKDAVVGKPDISQITGPVGIVGLVGDASRLGFAYLVTFTALISINLAIINLVPFPALDGGRIVFVAIESVTKKSINSKVAGILNTAGFVILIALMLFVTYRDILKLF